MLKKDSTFLFKYKGVLLAAVLLFLFSSEAFSQHKGLTVQLVIKKPDGTYPSVPGLTVTLQILDPITNCVLREEEHSGVNVTNGYMNLVVGASSATTPLGKNPTPVLSIPEVMDNSTPRTGLNCVDSNDNVVSTGQTYVPDNTHARKLRLITNISGAPIIADFNMRAVAFAVNSENFDGKTADKFIQTTTDVTQPRVNALLAPSVYDNLLNLSTSNTGSFTLPAGTTAQRPTGSIGSIRYNTTTNSVEYHNGTSWTAFGAGSVTSVSSANSYLTVDSTTASAPVLTVNVGTSANTVAAGDDSRIIGAIQNAGNTPNIQTGAEASKPASNGTGRLYISSDGQRIYRDDNSVGWSIVGTRDYNDLINKPAASGYVPSQTGNAGKFLTTDGSTASWVNLSVPWGNVTGTPTTISGYGIIDALTNFGGSPGVMADITANKPLPNAITPGKIFVDTSTLKVYRDNGVTWDLISTLDYNDLANRPTANSLLPSQATNSGKFLTTDGTNLSWNTVAGDNLGNHTATSNIQLNGYWLSGDGGNEGVFVDSSGNVGVKTNSPFFDFDVNGTARATQFRTSSNWFDESGMFIGNGVSGSAISIQRNAGGQSHVYIRQDSNDSYGASILGAKTRASSPYLTQANDKIFSLIGSGYGSGIATSGNVRIDMMAAENFSNTANGTYMTFTTTPIGSTNFVERMRITDAGNVGIGSLSPTSKLEVVGTSGATLKIVDGNQGAGKVLQSDANGNASWVTPGGSESTSVTNVGSVGTGIYKQMTGSDIELKKLNAGSNKVVITDDVANSKIDLDVDQTKLSIAWSQLTSAPTTLAGYGITDAIGSATLTTKGDLLVRDSSAPTRLGVGTDGYVLTADSAQGTGLKWSAIPSQLPSQATNAGKYLTTDGTTTSWATVAGDNLGNHTATANIQLNGHWLSGDGGNEGVFVDSVGNVGIGTSSPLTPLHVKGVGATADDIYIETDSAASRPVAITFDDKRSSGKKFRIGSGAVATGEFAIVDKSNNFNILQSSNGKIGMAGGGSYSLLTLPPSALNLNFDPSSGILVGANSIVGIDAGLSIAHGGKGSSSNLGARFNLIGVNSKYNNTTDTIERNDSSWSPYLDAMAISMSADNTRTGGNRISFWAGNQAHPTEIVSMATSGNVGINSVTPTTKLDIIGTTGTTLKIVDGNQGTGKVLTSDANGVASWMTPTAALPSGAASNYLVRTMSYGGTSLTGLQTLSGVALNDGDRVLVMNNFGGPSVGVYIAHTGAWTRAPELDTWNEAVGFTATVTEGTFAGISYVSLAAPGGTLGSTVFQFQPRGITTTYDNVAMGGIAFPYLTTGRNNISLGGPSGLMNVTSGSGNISAGGLGQTTTGNNNIGLGSTAGYNNTTGSNNVAVGAMSFYSASAISDAVAVGYSAMKGATGNQNTALGAYAMESSGAGVSNTAVGYKALNRNTSGNNSVAVGWGALELNNTGSGNVGIGLWAGYFNQSGNNNIAIGQQAIQMNNGSENIGIGYFSLRNSYAAAGNVAIGQETMQGAGNNSNNVAIGYQAFYANGGSGNVGVGARAGYATASGASDDIFIGPMSGYSNTTGSGNIAVGPAALYSNTVSNNNSALGDYALYSTTGASNIGIGYHAGYSLTTGSNNVIIGSNDGASIATSSGNILLSDGAGNIRLQADNTGLVSIPGTLKIAGGTPGAGKVLTSDASGVASWASPSSGADNLGNHTATQNLILGSNWLSGDGGNEGLRVDANGKVGIGTSAPAAQLEVAGGPFKNYTYASGMPVVTAQAFIYNDYGGVRTDDVLAIAGNNSPSETNILNAIYNGSTVFAVRSSGKVGINSATPSTKLDIVGTSGTTLKIVDGNQGAGKILTSDASGVASWAAAPAASAAGSNTQVQFNNSGALGANSNFVWDNSNSRLGIGTTTPSSMLEVKPSLTGTGTATGVVFAPTVNMSGTGSYTGVLINQTTTAVGSGNLYPFRVARDGFDLFWISHMGDGFFNGNLSAANLTVNQDLNGKSISAIKSTATTYLATSGGAAYPSTPGGMVSAVNESWTDSTYSLLRLSATNGAGTAQNAYMAAVSNAGSTPTITIGQQTGATAYTERMRIDSSGNVAIGTTAARATLDVDGAIVGKASTLNSTSTVDFSAGNIQHTTANCGSFALWNLQDGGSYMFVVKGTTAATCSFTAFSGAGSGSLTLHMPPDHGITTTGKHTVYNIAVSGGDVYVSWTPGY